MNKVVTFYFDFVSPYSYLAQTQIMSMAKETGAVVEYVPVFLGGLHQAQEVTSPPFIPSKAKWIVRDCYLWAQQYQLPLRWPSQFPFNTLSLLRVCTWLQQNNPDKVANFVDQTFKALWEEGLNCHDKNEVGEYLHSQGLDDRILAEALSSPDIKQVLMGNGELAVLKDMFGLPVFEVDEKLYFGQDRLHFVRQALSGMPMVDGPA
jgi:2-hydroxychromene-2-carboxylate isomerase